MGSEIKSLSSKAEIHQLDVSNPTSIQEFKTVIGDSPVDLLLNVAGVTASPDADSLKTTTLDILQSTFAVNTFGPLLLTQSLLPNVLNSQGKKIGIVSSRVASVGDNSTGGHYAYRSSKAAVNSIGKSMAMDLKDKGVTVMLLHPGMVWSNMVLKFLPPTAEMRPEMVLPKEAAEKLWRNIVSQKGLEDTGKFWHREGYELPW